jgi:soluble lytic murein transglycosylase-like protein
MRELIAALAALFGSSQLTRMMVSGKYRGLYIAAGKRHRVDPNLLHAIALKETGEQPQLVSPANTNGTRDYGLMQINDVNLAKYGLTTTTALDPAKNIDAAARLVRDILAAAPTFSVLDVFSVYNAGFSDHDADPATPGKQLRPKLSADNASYFNAGYVREAWMLYLIVCWGSLAPVKTNWTE